MGDARWRRIEEICHGALQREPDERPAFVRAACGADEALLTEVESLLANADRAKDSGLGMRNLGLELIGTRIGGYEIVSLLGAGGMGEVYRARDMKLGREVALKVLAKSAAPDPSYLQRFEEEARLASVLNHPNIVTIYGVGEEGDIAFIAMELVRGLTLRALLADGVLRVGEVLDLAAPLADALAAAHESGIVHRDLKPENVMVTAEGLVKVLDFGLAKRPRGIADYAEDQVETRAALTQDGMILGTVNYMSPEQAAGRPAGIASDQFAFGVVFYELLSGRRAFERDTPVETLSAIIREHPTPIREIRAAVTVPIQQIVDRCLAKSPADRYADTRQLAAQLRDDSRAVGPCDRGRCAACAHGRTPRVDDGFWCCQSSRRRDTTSCALARRRGNHDRGGRCWRLATLAAGHRDSAHWPCCRLATWQTTQTSITCATVLLKA